MARNRILSMEQSTILNNIKEKLGIVQLNAMQTTIAKRSDQSGDLIIYSPTGSGKTLAYSFNLLSRINASCTGQLQAIVVTPSRELVMQIYDVVRVLATGCKVTCLYGGHSVVDEKRSIEALPDIVVATPGRLLDHVKRGHVSLNGVKVVVIDEFDKCLELGFEGEMRQLCRCMPPCAQHILTSATVLDEIPAYTGISHPKIFDFTHDSNAPSSRMKTYQVKSASKDKLDTLLQLLLSLPGGRTIVFVNYREAVARVYQHLKSRNMLVGLYHGALDQIEREKAIALFANGTFQILVTTDLGARGLDIDGVKHIVHYHMPISPEVFVHRNGRTARVDARGNVFVVTGPGEEPPGYMHLDGVYTPIELNPPTTKREEVLPAMATIYFKAGKKEKISKGDILGFLIHQGELSATDIGTINVFDHYSLAAVPRNTIENLISKLSHCKIKSKKVLVSRAVQRV